jgi:hypothetical protein
LNSIDGATALKLDERYELEEQEQVVNNSTNNELDQLDSQNLQKTLAETEHVTNDLPTGVSIESASYMENSNLVEDINNASFTDNNDNDEEYTPKLFSDEQNYESEEMISSSNDQDSSGSDQLFDQDINEEEDFEIPAFLRKQKF